MNKEQIKILKESLNIDLSEVKSKLFNQYEDIFLQKNAHTNLISKKDEALLFEKHIFDSLAINKFLDPKEGEKLLDFGTGGGFPSVPVSILYDNLSVYAVDSIAKKINLIEEMKTDLKLKNLHPICSRVENLKIYEFDYATSRAVAPIDVILKYATPKLKKGGYFIAYKSKKALEELKNAENTIKSTGVKLINIIEYKLPLEEVYERNLVIFQKITSKK